MLQIDGNKVVAGGHLRINQLLTQAQTFMAAQRKAPAQRAILSLAKPALRLHHLERIGRGHQHLHQQVVGIQRDRRQQLLQLRLRQAVLLRGHGDGRGRSINLAPPLLYGAIAI